MEPLKLLPLHFKRPLFFLAVILFFSLSLSAQDRCGTLEYTKTLVRKKLRSEQVEQFENWLNAKLKARKKGGLDAGRTQTTTYQIPVVVHIIHNGEALGTGVNISDAQILSQLEVLNNDFQRLNMDASNTPSEFLPVAGNMSIEFVLAKQNPAGSPSTGIVRVQGTKTLWSMNDDPQLKAVSYWPAEDYFNIWICNLSNYLGYTQFPISNLPGLEDSSTNRLTDGVVIGYQYFGTVDAGNFNLANRYNKGRTVTHEVGHFFGLRHIWGDDGGKCITDSGGESDFVSDTPDQGGNTNGCPQSPRTSCSVHSMYPNYMDYTDDACMNLFTKEQVTRMTTVLENSIRRKTLFLSHGLIDPAAVSDNLGIEKIISPLLDECTHTLLPSIEIKNYGNNTVTSAKIQVLINSVVEETLTVPLNLTVGQSTVVNFQALTRNAGNSSFVFTILQTNGKTDGETSNDTRSINTMISDRIGTPFEENFSSLPFNWKVKNPDMEISWSVQNAPFYMPTNTAVSMNFFKYQNENASDILISPPFDLTNENLAFFSFDVAYAQDKTKIDGLQVFLLTNCNTDVSLGIQVYAKFGSELATTTPTSISFIPKDENEWRKEFVDLTNYIGQNNLRLAFVGTNGYGNNLYIDNVSMITSVDIDAAIASIENPLIISCVEPSPKVVVQNVGTVVLTSFNIEYQVNAGEVQIMPVTNISLKSGGLYEVTLPVVTLKNGTNTITFKVSNPNNNGADLNAQNDKKSTTVVASNASLTIPFRENFNTGFGTHWISLNPTNGMRWSLAETNYKTSTAFNAFTNTTDNDEAWLVSPALDFTNTEEASLYFDRSYSISEENPKGEQLRILGSIGCGNAFDLTLYDNSKVELANVFEDNNNWKPTLAADWAREFVDFSALSGKKDVRIAFVVRNGNGNNLYLDNLEFYTTVAPDVTPLKKSFAVYTPSDDIDFRIRFNLPQQQLVELEIIDVMGRSILNKRLEYILNQQYDVQLDAAATGVYIVRIHTAAGYDSQRVFIQK